MVGWLLVERASELVTAEGASNADVAVAISHMPRLEILRSRAEWIANITSAQSQKGENPPEGLKNHSKFANKH